MPRIAADDARDHLVQTVEVGAFAQVDPLYIKAQSCLLQKSAWDSPLVRMPLATEPYSRCCHADGFAQTLRFAVEAILIARQGPDVSDVVPRDGIETAKRMIRSTIASAAATRP